MFSCRHGRDLQDEQRHEWFFAPRFDSSVVILEPELSGGAGRSKFGLEGRLMLTSPAVVLYLQMSGNDLINRHDESHHLRCKHPFRL